MMLRLIKKNNFKLCQNDCKATYVTILTYQKTVNIYLRQKNNKNPYVLRCAFYYFLEMHSNKHANGK